MIGNPSGLAIGTCSITERPRTVDKYASDRQVITNIPAQMAVALVNTVAALPPKSDCAVVPLSASDMPPRPPCNRITPMRIREIKTCTTSTKP